MSRFDDVNAICPYFRASDEREIRCEGIVAGSSMAIKFNSQKKRDKHRALFCDAKYENCEIRKMLEKKYS